MSYNRQITINCTNSPSAECTVEAALSIIGGKWKLKIYKVLKNGVPQRYSSLGKAIADISEKTLAAQLKQLRQATIMGSRPGGSYGEYSSGVLTVDLPHSKNIVIVNPTIVRTHFPADTAVAIKNVDVEIVPDYHPKASVYKKNREAVVLRALEALQPATVN